MENFLIFGLDLKTILFNLFLPMILFYIILYVFLKRSKIFGEVSNYYYSLTSLVLSSISVFSLHSMGLTYLLPYMAAFITITAFFLTYIYGILKQSQLTIESMQYTYQKISDEIRILIENLKKETNEEKKEVMKRELRKKLDIAKNIAMKEGRNIEGEDWYKKAKELVG